MAPVWLTATEVARYYEAVANGVIWPLFHYLPDQMPLHVQLVREGTGEVVDEVYRG
jgi:trehalose-6-phosphate synthase